MNQEINDENRIKRNDLTQYFHNGLRIDSNFRRRITFSSECRFSLSGTVNKQNCGIYSSELAKQVYEALHNTFFVIV